MAFIVPKFIEKEPKIVGPLTFKQFMFFLIASGVGFFFYLSFGKKNMFLFLILMTIVVGFAFLLAFGKVGGRPFPVFFKNLLNFLISPKLFLFKRKIFGLSIFHPKVGKLNEEGGMLGLRPKDKSGLHKISTKILTRR